MKKIEITGVGQMDTERLVIGYAVCRQWRDNPRDVEVFEYADSEKHAKEMIKKLPKNEEQYVWFVGYTNEGGIAKPATRTKMTDLNPL